MGSEPQSAGERLASLEGAVAIVGNAKDLNFNYYQLQYGAGEPSPAVRENFGGNIEGKTYRSGQQWATRENWETTGLNGVYTLSLTATDLAGNQAAVGAVGQSDQLSFADQRSLAAKRRVADRLCHSQPIQPDDQRDADL